MRIVRGVVKIVVLAAVGLILLPTRLELPDIVIVPQAAASGFYPNHFVASPFGTIHASLITFPELAGAETADVRRASLDLNDPSVTGSIASRAVIDTRYPNRVIVFPQVNRIDKSDRLVPAERPAPQAARANAPGAGNCVGALAGSPAVTTAPPPAPPAPAPKARAAPATAPAAAAQSAAPPAQDMQLASYVDEGADAAKKPVTEATQIFFGVAPMGGMLNTMQPWSPDDPIVVDAPGDAPTDAAAAASAPAAAPAAAPNTGETIADNGDMTGDGRHPKSPAERLGLVDKARAKAEKCLASAIYFEARGEQVRGQMAVAQVVMNRVFSGYYPHDVCGVVYQDSNRHLACQFTFACDGIPDVINEPDAWVRAREIARDTLDGKLWLPDIGKATHYHAYWVRPAWIREMQKLDRIGVHTFYRPRAWGDGADAPVWGDAATTKEAEKKL
jgi:spore germination cell wall hydrolase CwlJ-like protein